MSLHCISADGKHQSSVHIYQHMPGVFLRQQRQSMVHIFQRTALLSAGRCYLCKLAAVMGGNAFDMAPFATTSILCSLEMYPFTSFLTIRLLTVHSICTTKRRVILTPGASMACDLQAFERQGNGGLLLCTHPSRTAKYLLTRLLSSSTTMHYFGMVK